ncbi:MAG: exodeoxyribonuclease VII large subunit [Pseudomonadota bacterium]
MTTDNVPEYSVSELSGKLKRTIEDTYGYVRVRGELGRVTRAASGHVYLDMKDERAVISSVMWKGTAARQTVKPEQGLEVVATGRMSTFPGQSRYQLIIDTLAPAGAGALMALYEERKKKLAAEGLFAAERKRPIPKLPGRIGVVTSPSGAVIRDILHRLRDRFPSHVLVWPSVVQGEGAPAQIVRGIKGLAALPEAMRPDVVIVARGGGSLEDLWCFNDEDVVRAAAASPIPLISAVGHETDTTLIDYAADLRAPTPTAAAELAVPVRTELLSDVANLEGRLMRQLTAQTEGARLRLQAAARGLGSPDGLIAPAVQRLDRADEQLRNAAHRALGERELRLGRIAPRLVPSLLRGDTHRRSDRLAAAGERLGAALQRNRERHERRLADQRLPTGLLRSRLDAMTSSLSQAERLLASVSYHGVLERGFALVSGPEGTLIKTSKEAAKAPEIAVTFADGPVRATPLGAGAKGSAKKARPKSQGTLFED